MNIRGIKGFVETSFVDWTGRISSVLFLGGCNFRCPFCHNKQLVSNSRNMEDIPFSDILDRLDRMRGWVDGVSISGGEPTLYPDLPVIMETVRERGFPVKLFTNGSRPDVLSALLDRGLLEAVSMDVKAQPHDEEKYCRLAGRAVPMDRIRASILLLYDSGIEVSFCTTVAPGLLSKEDVVEIAMVLPEGIPYHVQNARLDDVLDENLSGTAPYTDETVSGMQRAVEILRPKKLLKSRVALPESEPPAPVWTLFPDEEDRSKSRINA